MLVIHWLSSYFQILGVWDTRNCELPVSGTPGIAIPGVPYTGEMRIHGVHEMRNAGAQDNGDLQKIHCIKIVDVRDTGEMQNASVRDTGESGNAGVPDTDKWIFDCFLFLHIPHLTIDTDLKGTTC